MTTELDDRSFEDAVVEPVSGDKITVTRPDGKAHIYEVMPIGTAGPFQPSDPGGATLRIHTKEVGLVL